MVGSPGVSWGTARVEVIKIPPKIFHNIWLPSTPMQVESWGRIAPGEGFVEMWLVLLMAWGYMNYMMKEFVSKGS